MSSFTYPVALSFDTKVGGYVVTCRDIPEAITQGETIEDALEAATGALEAAIEMRIEDALEIPTPSTKKRNEHLIALPVATAMKAALYLAMNEQGVSKIELARRLNLDEKAARRILNPKHPTKVCTIERALHALGKKVEVVIA